MMSNLYEKRNEVWYRDKLQQKLGGEVEVKTPSESGYVDLLTPTHLIEVKVACLWKAGIGQLLVYGEDYPFHCKYLYLFGKMNDKTWSNVVKNCKKFRIVVKHPKKTISFPWSEPSENRPKYKSLTRAELEE